jgi:hypothetical protein
MTIHAFPEIRLYDEMRMFHAQNAMICASPSPSVPPKLPPAEGHFDYRDINLRGSQ